MAYAASRLQAKNAAAGVLHLPSWCDFIIIIIRRKNKKQRKEERKKRSKELIIIQHLSQRNLSPIHHPALLFSNL